MSDKKMNIFSKVQRRFKRDLSGIHLNLLEKIKKEIQAIKWDHQFISDFLSKEFYMDNGQDVTYEDSITDYLLNPAKEGVSLPGGVFCLNVDYSDERIYRFVIQQKPQVRTINFEEDFFVEDELNYSKKYKKDYPDHDRYSLRLAFPYIVFFMEIDRDYDFGSSFNAFYTNKPLSSLDDALYCVNLPNCYGGKVCLSEDGQPYTRNPSVETIISELMDDF